MVGLHTLAEDFPHKQPGLLNSGSFGSAPECVYKEQQYFHDVWKSNPDAMFFGKTLFKKMHAAVDSTIAMLTKSPEKIDAKQLALLDNACAATVAIARRWGKRVQPGDVVFTLDTVYGASSNCLKEYCEDRRAGASVVTLSLFTEQKSLPQTRAEIVRRFRESLKTYCEGRLNSDLTSKSNSESTTMYFFLDHVTSQPMFVCPLEDMIQEVGQLLNTFPSLKLGEIAVDGAHSFAVPDLDIVRQFAGLPDSLKPHWWFANLHKWGFAASTAAVLYARTPELMQDSGHPLVSWFRGSGLREESMWVGTRDYSALLSVPKAVEYFLLWKDNEGCTAPEYSTKMVTKAARYLADRWGTIEFLAEPELNCAMAMIKLPDGLTNINDQLGPAMACENSESSQQTRTVRTQLREDFGLEAYVKEQEPVGNYLRLSFAVYNTWQDIEKLADAVLTILERQRLKTCGLRDEPSKTDVSKSEDQRAAGY